MRARAAPSPRGGLQGMVRGMVPCVPHFKDCEIHPVMRYIVSLDLTLPHGSQPQEDYQRDLVGGELALTLI